MNKKHIFLTGFMGAGKSRIGRQLADLLNRPFVDTDQEIEKKSARTIRQIFEQEGEERFRQLEKETIKRFCAADMPLVVALGGGALNDPSTFKRVHQTGIVVYLKSSPQAILNRVAHSTKRPLLDVDDVHNRKAILTERIRALLEKREPIYLQADIIFDRDGLEAEQVAQALVKQIEWYWKEHNG